MEHNWNEYNGSAEPEQVLQPEPAAPEQVPQPNPMPYADDLYESAGLQPEPVPVKPKKPEKEKKKRPPVALITVLALLLVAGSVAVTAALCGVYWQEQLSVQNQAAVERVAVLQAQLDDLKEAVAVAGSGEVTEDTMTPGQVYARSVDAVVAVSGYVADNQSQYESFGSGFLIDATGYVVTNYHVIQDANMLTVTLSDGREFDAEAIGYDATNDIALLKIEGEKFPFVPIGSSDALAVGDRVVAIGNPLGELTSTLTVGYVSAKDRIVTTDGTAINMLQTDAAINSGNSGGPLLNMQGQVVGITTAKYSGTSASGVGIEGIGFAIPMDDVIGMIQDLRDYGYIKGTFLGVYVRDVSAAAVQDGLPAGAFIEEIIPGYCAEEAGLMARDIILEVGGNRVTNITELTRCLRKFEGGDVTTVTVYRNGMRITVTVTLDEKVQEETVPEPQDQILMPGDEGFEDWYEEFIERFYGED